MANKTPLFDHHCQAGGKIVDFAGWQLPIAYQSQIKEHHQVRHDAGMFDVSHMTVIDFSGPQTQAFLKYLLANNIERLQSPGKALYSCMLNDNAGVIDDLIVYYIAANQYRMVVNAATRDQDMAWINQQSADFDTKLHERTDLAMIAVQGPNARDKTLATLPTMVRHPAENLKKFFAIMTDDFFIARTGYTGEDGFEIILPQHQVGAFWDRLHQAGVQPCGLGARDTLRLEAGMNLYGTDMDENTHPLESGLGWTIAWEPIDRDFIGRKALTTIREQGNNLKFVGLLSQGKGIFRSHQKIMSNDVVIGEITSGGFSPTLDNAIAFARVFPDVSDSVQVEIRGKLIPAKVVKPVFVRDGKPCHGAT